MRALLWPSRAKGRAPLVVAAAATLVAAVLGSVQGPMAPAGAEPTSRPLLGVSTPGVPAVFGDLDQFEAGAGKRADIVGYYVAWTQANFDPAAAQAIRARGSIPMLTWEPWDPGKGLDQPAYRLGRILDGTHDAYITRWAQAIRDWGQPMYLRFAHEMNGDWYPWAERANGNQPGEYAEAWRHVRAIFRAVGANNAAWVWSPNVNYAGSPTLSGLYPGNADVDRLGVDGYNGGTALNWGGWLGFEQIFGPTLAELRKLATKPIIIAETASTEAGGDKAAWITDFFAQLSKIPDIEAFVWFNFDKETDWRIQSSAAAQRAFAAGVAGITTTQDAGYTPLTPARVLDTRPGQLDSDGLNAAVGPGQTIDVQVTGVGGVPATGAGAVVLNVAVTAGTTGGHIVAWPTGQPRPLASNLNFSAGQTIANLVVAKVGSDGRVSIFNGSGSTHVIADVQGWFSAASASGYTPLSPARTLDTRLGQLDSDGLNAAVGPGQTIDVQVTGVGGVPATGAGAVVLNVAVTAGTTGGHIVAWPTGQPRPLASNLNFSAGQTIANLVVAKVGSDGRVSIFNGSGSTHVIADVQGWFSAASASGYTPLSPARTLDTRLGQLDSDGLNAAVGPGQTIDVQVTGVGGVPATGAGAVVLNVAVTAGTTGGHIVAWPTGQPRPLASNLNFSAGQTIANLVVAKVGSDGRVSIFNGSGSTHVIADVQGWFAT